MQKTPKTLIQEGHLLELTLAYAYMAQRMAELSIYFACPTVLDKEVPKDCTTYLKTVVWMSWGDSGLQEFAIGSDCLLLENMCLFSVLQDTPGERKPHMFLLHLCQVLQSRRKKRFCYAVLIPFYLDKPGMPPYSQNT